MQKIFYDVLNDMSEVLNIQQMRALQETLIKWLQDNTTDKEQSLDNMEYLNMFVAAKRIEGCSERTIEYYRITICNMMKKIDIPIRQITTDDLREYLTEYQAQNGCSKVTVDNIRRNLSSFFSWLEDEDHVLKSPIRRIHKVRTGTRVKETLSDENIELLRDNCAHIRDLAIIDLLYSTGIRVGELVNLNIEDINFEERECVVYGKGNRQQSDTTMHYAMVSQNNVKNSHRKYMT